jgi:rhodanese-related sulfurtransferase
VTIDTMLAAARADLDRVTARQADAERRAGALLVDIRPFVNRSAEGEIPGSVPVERIVLEWRLDPASGHCLPGITPDTRVIVLCNEGYSSSLAARDLRLLGLHRATDLIGGFRAWHAEGLPVQPGGTPAVP